MFVLDFANDVETIRDAFADYYQTTILADETDPDKLHDLKADLDGCQVYDQAQIDDVVGLYLKGADRDKLDPILDACVEVYREHLDEDGQVDFKGKAKGFLRAYGFLASILPYTNAEWEKLSIFLTFLVPKLPAPMEDDLSKGILEAIDMDSYRVEKQAVQSIQLPEEDAEIDPVPTSAGGQKPEPEFDMLSNILNEFNDLFGNIDWQDADKTPPGDHRGPAGQSVRQHSLPKRYGPLRRTERPHRTCQSPGAGRYRPGGRLHGAFQAVQRQQRVPRLVAGEDVRHDLRAAGPRRRPDRMTPPLVR